MAKGGSSSGGGSPAPSPPPSSSKAPAFPYPSSHYLGRPDSSDQWHDGHGHGQDSTHVHTWQQQMAFRGWDIDPDGVYGPASEERRRIVPASEGPHGRREGRAADLGDIMDRTDHMSLRIGIFRLLAAACFIVALVDDASSSTLFGAGWFIWTSAGLIAWALEPLLTR